MSTAEEGAQSRQDGSTPLHSARRTRTEARFLSAQYPSVHNPSLPAGNSHSTRSPPQTHGSLRIIPTSTHTNATNVLRGITRQNRHPIIPPLTRHPKLESKVLLGILAEASPVTNSFRRPRIGTHLQLPIRDDRMVNEDEYSPEGHPGIPPRRILPGSMNLDQLDPLQ